MTADWSEYSVKAGKALAAMNRHAALGHYALAKAAAEYLCWCSIQAETAFDAQLTGTVAKIPEDAGA